MELESFHEFIELAKRLNFTETARILHMSQPTLSKHISALEKELRISLFDRSGPQLALTSAGQAILPFSYKILGYKNEMMEKLKEVKSSAIPHLSVGGLVEEGRVLAILRNIICELGEIYGTNFIEVKGIQHKNLAEAISHLDFDLIFDYVDEDDDIDESIGVIPVAKAPLYAVVNRSHHLANRKTIALQDLRQEVFVKLEGGHACEAWRFIERRCKDAGFAPKLKTTYFMKVTDLLTVTANLEQNVLILTEGTVNRMGPSFSFRCSCIPIVDETAYLPISATFRIENFNPVLEDIIELLNNKTLCLDATNLC